MTRRMVLVVAAALYDAEGRILLAQRPAGKPMAGLWEFPGGKVETGETPEWDGELVPREGQSLAWVKSSDLHLYPAPAADIPLFDVLSGN